jgi:hypothetical protein
MMSPRVLFGVAIRVMGIWNLANAIYWVTWAFSKSNGGPGNVNVSVGQDVVNALIDLVTGFGLIILADYIALALYGPVSKPDAGGTLSTDVIRDEAPPPQR